MNCPETQALLSEYIDGELEDYRRQAVQVHLHSCPDCRRQARAMEEAWEMLGELKEIEPNPDYVARFWARVQARKPWYEELLRRVRTALAPRRLVPVLATALIIIAVGFGLMRLYPQSPMPNAIIADLSSVDLNMIEQMDMIQDLEVLQAIDFLSDLEVIEKFVEPATS